MITKLSIRNFKSLRELHIAMGPLMVLVGPNASGKSNFLEALKFLKIPDDVAAPAGGYQKLVWNSDPESEIVIGIQGDYPAKKNSSVPFDYEFRLGSATASFVRSEKGLIEDLRKNVNNWAFYRFSPGKMRPSQPVRQQARLTEDGSNLSTVIHSLFSEGNPAYREIEDLFKGFIPEVEQLVSPVVADNATSVTYKQKGLRVLIDTSLMSDGTLFGLALIVALFAPERPPLIGIEAPDMELHPYSMQHVAELLRTASQYAQIIITTHSPFLLDYLPPEAIAIVEKVNGETKIWWAQDKKGVKQAIKLLGAGEAWRAGHLGGVPA